MAYLRKISCSEACPWSPHPGTQASEASSFAGTPAATGRLGPGIVIQFRNYGKIKILSDHRTLMKNQNNICLNIGTILLIKKRHIRLSMQYSLCH